ncbi:isoprenylcysteine carboxylmethyltransferase family protein [Patescibacteria group bacterium]|nr:isoprenylcysteine carboxylmethyltransferase family protein [Patescibacteria group bacterium]
MMKNNRKKLFHIIAHYLVAALVLGQVAATIFGGSVEIVESVRLAGWILLVISGVFGWLPVYELRSKGGVSAGAGFVNTTVLVDSGVYSIVRHPQFLGGIFLGVALMLISQYWLVVVLGIPVVLLFILAIIEDDKQSLEKFGDDYRDYMDRVPQANLAAGLLRKLK